MGMKKKRNDEIGEGGRLYCRMSVRWPRLHEIENCCMWCPHLSDSTDIYRISDRSSGKIQWSEEPCWSHMASILTALSRANRIIIVVSSRTVWLNHGIMGLYNNRTHPLNSWWLSNSSEKVRCCSWHGMLTRHHLVSVHRRSSPSISCWDNIWVSK